MRVLFAGSQRVDYSQFFLAGDDWTTEDMGLCFGGQRNGLCGAALPGGLWLITGLFLGEVGLTVEAHDAEPPLDPVWEDVVEVSCTPTGGWVLWDGFTATVAVELDPVPSRVRYSAVGIDAGHAVDFRDEDDPEVDRYLLQFWPAGPAPDAVLRRTSESAILRHRDARAFPPVDDVPGRLAALRRANDAANQEPDYERPSTSARSNDTGCSSCS